MADSRQVTRRNFLQSAALGAGALMTIGAPGLAGAAGKMPTVKLGKTGAVIPKLGFGSAFDLTPRLVGVALNEGLTYIDTAEGYNNGNSERAIGEILEQLGRRKECFIVSKTGRQVPAILEERLAASLERLRTDCVDAYYLHNLGDPALLNDEMKGSVDKLKKAGKIKFFGFSSHHRNMIATLEKAAEVGFVDVIMFKYNFLDYDNGALNRAVDACAEAKIGLIAMKTQGGAATVAGRVEKFKEKGFNPFQAALKAVWDDDRIHAAVSEMTTVSMVRENTTAAKEAKLGALEREQLDLLAAGVSAEYCRGCGNICETAMGTGVNIADTLRYRLYHQGYGKPEDARRLFREIPPEGRQIAGADFTAAEKACPYRLPVGKMMNEAASLLA